MNCPDCKKWLKEGAIGCRCGWRELAQPKPDTGARGHACEAYGCPALGSWTANTNGTGPWWCFVHGALSTHDLQQVTAGIHARGWMLRLLGWLYTMPIVDWEPHRVQAVAERLREVGRDDLVPSGDETRSPKAYARRIEQALIAEVRSESATRRSIEQRTPSAGVPDFFRRSSEFAREELAA